MVLVSYGISGGAIGAEDKLEDEFGERGEDIIDGEAADVDAKTRPRIHTGLGVFFNYVLDDSSLAFAAATQNPRGFCDGLQNCSSEVVVELLRHLTPRFSDLPLESATALLSAALGSAVLLERELRALVSHLDDRAVGDAVTLRTLVMLQDAGIELQDLGARLQSLLITLLGRDAIGADACRCVRAEYVSRLESPLVLRWVALVVACESIPAVLRALDPDLIGAFAAALRSSPVRMRIWGIPRDAYVKLLQDAGVRWVCGDPMIGRSLASAEGRGVNALGCRIILFVLISIARVQFSRVKVCGRRLVLFEVSANLRFPCPGWVSRVPALDFGESEVKPRDFCLRPVSAKLSVSEVSRDSSAQPASSKSGAKNRLRPPVHKAEPRYI
jgi:hypothetical protein